jgi:hypothetical protein
VRKLIGLLLTLVACGGSPAGPTEIPDAIRDQLHAATGHEPDSCGDLRTGAAVIEITPEGFSPECAIVSIEQSIVVRNIQDTDDTWIVADPENNLVPRHVRILREIPAGGEVEVPLIRDIAPSGVWPCYGRESRHQCQLVIVP